MAAAGSPRQRDLRRMRAFTALLSLLVVTLVAASTGAPVAAPADAVESRDVSVANGTIHVESIAGNGDAVLLIHGGFGDRRMWDAQFPGLVPGAHMLRMDLRGFGKSSFPEVAYVASDDVLAVLDAFAIERAHLVGNSMGGGLAIDFALAHPDRVASLVVEASGPNGFPATKAERARYRADIEAIQQVFRIAAAEGEQRGAERWLESGMVAVASRDPEVAPLLRTMVFANSRIFAMAYWPDDERSAVSRLHELRVPTLFVVGDRDVELVRDAVDYGVARIAGARKVVIAGTDHLPHLERPDAFARHVRAFIAANPAR